MEPEYFGVDIKRTYAEMEHIADTYSAAAQLLDAQGDDMLGSQVRHKAKIWRKRIDMISYSIKKSLEEGYK